MNDQTEKEILAALREISMTMNYLFIEMQKVNDHLQVIEDCQRRAHPAPPPQPRRP